MHDPEILDNSSLSRLPQRNTSLVFKWEKMLSYSLQSKFGLFLQELLTLPALVRKSEVVLDFFGALNGQNETIER